MVAGTTRRSSVRGGEARVRNEELWCQKEVVRFLRIHRQTLWRLMATREQSGFPAPRNVTCGPGGRRWVAAEIRAWVDRDRQK